MSLARTRVVLLQLLLSSSISSASTIQWSAKAPMPTGRDAIGIGVADGKIYTMSGRQGRNGCEVEVYDPNEDRWEVLPDIPWGTFWPFKRAIRNAGTAVIDDSIYLFSLETSDFLKYTPSTNRWIRKWSPIAPRYGGYFTCAVADRKLYVFGGLDKNYSPISDVWSYDPHSDTWSKMSSEFPNPREVAVVATWQNHIFAIGGSVSISHGDDSLESHVTTVDMFDPNNDTWEAVADIPGVVGDGGAAVIGNKIFVFGACSYEYDIKGNLWTETAKVPANQTNDIGVASIDNRIYIMGGFDDGDPSDKQMVHEGRVVSRSPQPQVFVNGLRQPIARLLAGDSYELAISLHAGDYSGHGADLWIAREALEDDELTWFTAELGWVRSETPLPYYSGNLHDIPYETIYVSGPLEPGNYTVTLMVDPEMNGLRDTAYMYLDDVIVSVGGSQP